MKKSLSMAFACAIGLSVLSPHGANAEVPNEDPMNACFDSKSGYVDRYVYQERDLSRDYVSSSWNLSNELVRISGESYRAESFSGFSYRESTSASAVEYYINYDYSNDIKFVEKVSFDFTSFYSFVYQSVVGWLLDDDGNDSSSTSFTMRASTGGYERSNFDVSTSVIERDCTVPEDTEGGGSFSGVTALQTSTVVEFAVEPKTTETFQVSTYHSGGAGLALISVPAGSVTKAAKLRITNDIDSTENQLGFSSLGFQLVDETGRPVPLLAPMTVTYPLSGFGKLAGSDNGKIWQFLSKEGLESPNGAKVEFMSSSSFKINSMNSQGWIYVGQKTDQQRPVLYADRFATKSGQKIRLTSTSGSGDGAISLKSLTPGKCVVSDAFTVVGADTGVCKVAAVKDGHDGYMNSKTQVIRLEIKR